MCNTHVLTTVCSVTGLLPGPNCPKTSHVRIALPADEEGETDDSKYAMPTKRCSGHTSVTIDPSYLGPDDASTTSGSSGSSGGSGTAVPVLGLAVQAPAFFRGIEWAWTGLGVADTSAL